MWQRNNHFFIIKVINRDLLRSVPERKWNLPFLQMQNGLRNLIAHNQVVLPVKTHVNNRQAQNLSTFIIVGGYVKQLIMLQIIFH